ncbi:MAG: hypothetical protein CME67_00360 [Halobacteriovoraceae bacterium]|nr:hypothetical protein [Halobacteriovoraceae bacterium]
MLHKSVFFQCIRNLGVFGWSPLCGNADHPVIPGDGVCRPPSGYVVVGQGVSAPVAGLGVF